MEGMKAFTRGSVIITRSQCSQKGCGKEVLRKVLETEAVCGVFNRRCTSISLHVSLNNLSAVHDNPAIFIYVVI